MTIRISTHKQSTIEYTTADDTIKIDITIDCLDDSDHAYLAITKMSNKYVVCSTYKCKRDDVIKAINVVTRGYYGLYSAPADKCIMGETVEIKFEQYTGDFFIVTTDDIDLSMTRHQIDTFRRCFDHGAN